MVSTSPGYGITIRVEGPSANQPVSALTAVLNSQGASLTALDIVESSFDRVVIDITCDTIDADHADRVAKAIAQVPELKVRKVSDRTFLIHLGGKIEVNSKVQIKTRDDLDARRLTIKRNTVAVVTDGSAVLGLGNIGPAAAMPVMEGKAALFKRFANIDAWPVCLDTQDVDEIVRTVQIIAPVYGGINLEDISAPRCFEVERRLREILDIPVFHDDQHGTAIVVTAALKNALKLVKKNIEDVKIVLNGVGAAGTAVAQLLYHAGARHLIGFDVNGPIHKGSPKSDEQRSWFIEISNHENFTGSLGEALAGADVFIGVSVPNVLSEQDVQNMADGAIVFALANPDPEIDPEIARRHVKVVATGRSDQPNQINNVLAFPGVFRGLLDIGATKITEDALLAAADAIANCVRPEQLNESFIIPSVFDPAVTPAVASAIKATCR